MAILKCNQCKKEFATTISRQKYCSNKCCAQHWREINREKTRQSQRHWRERHLEKVKEKQMEDSMKRTFDQRRKSNQRQREKHRTNRLIIKTLERMGIPIPTI